MSGNFDCVTLPIFALNRERKELYERINARVARMLEDGLVDEIRRLNTLRLGKTATSAIGVKEILAFLDGQSSLEEAEELIKKNTRNYAKRQLTWFRKDPRFEWIVIGSGDSIDHAVQQLYRLVNSSDI